MVAQDFSKADPFWFPPPPCPAAHLVFLVDGSLSPTPRFRKPFGLNRAPVNLRLSKPPGGESLTEGTRE